MPRELTERPPKVTSNDPDDIKIGEAIRRAYTAKKKRLKAKGKPYTIEIMAKNVRLERSNLNKIMLGRSTTPETLLRIMQELGAKPREIFRDVKDMHKWRSLFAEGMTMTRAFPDRSKRRGARSLIELLDDDANAMSRLNDFLGQCDTESFLWARKNLLLIQQTVIRRRRQHIKAGTWKEARFQAKAERSSVRRAPDNEGQS